MIYLDNAATTWPKPSSVTEAVIRCMDKYGGNPGRGSHRLAMLAAESVYSCREAAAIANGLLNGEGGGSDAFAQGSGKRTDDWRELVAMVGQAILRML